ncbi:MAG TPA: DUF4041 domain-containing protein [Candidatus Aminicenantes bacterium]|nr:DUF4041 domain-containing protein [Candidatus Aminicenantes bacterium]HRY65033.1 DUF4041 domain-containing protein [Candidatus Aminicenantes bacterium]HRZ71946.1 DUF4041 domain-containing protein [Candidatus Aminicenantes bacterium]
MDIKILVILALIGLLIWAITQLLKAKKGYASLQEKYSPITDLEAHKDKLKDEAAATEVEISTLKEDYRNKKEIYDSLIKELALYEEEVEISSYGLYKPHFDFQTSEQYKEMLEEIKKKEKLLITDEGAYYCGTQWTVNNSRTEGKRQTKQYGKLMLRAFNGESDALISNVRWNNIAKSEERLEKSFEVINKLGTTHHIEITKKYYDLKLEELRLTYEYEEKRHQEKEEQRRIQEQIREEEKAQREYEKALKETEEEEKRYNKALEQARSELGTAQGAKLDDLNLKIATLETQLKGAQEKERALSQAQLTKSGHIYVISNIGAFGEDVFKIGMTRRLEPEERIKELGDASVPFEFDIHAMIHSDNAPELEGQIHKRIEGKKINLLNNRREFFKINMVELENIIHEFKADIELTKVAEAREYRETLAMREKVSVSNAEPVPPPATAKFPESI